MFIEIMLYLINIVKENALEVIHYIIHFTTCLCAVLSSCIYCSTSFTTVYRLTRSLFLCQVYTDRTPSLKVTYFSHVCIPVTARCYGSCLWYLLYCYLLPLIIFWSLIGWSMQVRHWWFGRGGTFIRTLPAFTVELIGGSDEAGPL